MQSHRVPVSDGLVIVNQLLSHNVLELIFVFKIDFILLLDLIVSTLEIVVVRVGTNLGWLIGTFTFASADEVAANAHC